MTDVIVIGGGVIGLSIARELSSSGKETIVLEKGARVAQIIMMENASAELYDGQWQKDKDVK